MCNNPISVEYKGKFRTIKLLRPCGHCMGCRVDSLLLWQSRCNSEYIKYRSAFVTFTYDKNHIEYNKGAIFPTLRRDDFTKYIDNLRHRLRNYPVMKNCNHKFKYFGCGEYGETGTLRDHFHVLFFGLDFHDYKNLFFDSWKKGFIYSNPILRGGVRYVCDYVTKQKTGDMAVKEYDLLGRERPFISVSQGLGTDFFLAHKDEISKTGNVTIGSRTIPVPTYYINLCSSFSYDDIGSRLRHIVESYRQTLRRMRIAGFDDYDKYMKYMRIVNENNLVSRARKNGSAAPDNLNVYSPYSPISDLARCALDNFNCEVSK